MTTAPPRTPNSVPLAAQSRKPSRMPWRQQRVPFSARALSFIVMGVFALYSLVPIWWLVVTATKSSEDLFTTNPMWFSDFSLWGNITDVFQQQDGIFAVWAGNTVIYCVGGAAISTMLAAMAGYALGKYEFPGRKLVSNAILAAVLVPGVLFALPLYLMFSEISLVNTYWSVLLPSLVSPFGVFLASTYATQAIPNELLEAARIDGASEPRIFWRIGFPIMAPALVTVFLFQFVAIWGNYLLPVLMLNNDTLQPLSVGLVNWRERLSQGIPYNMTITGSLLTVVPLLIAFSVLQRYWRSDLTAGGVK
ncbi:carbohydrate ABC transporter permease [Arthrobacter rhizosphaerae]|uniref:carbohydrate ABC transporter permease n=1 Tax=Arthrobacter rhizosphaerae TaxID=2855490 RepID=UPI001FF587D9|nr:carbohydrate ABC transporter permease [Arthrobacter rhizosphaerae]